MFGTMEPWGYGGYGQAHMVIWIILGIALVVGIAWREERALADDELRAAYCEGMVAAFEASGFKTSEGT